MVMTSILIPRNHQLDPITEWLDEHVGKKTTGNESYVRQFGKGWDIKVSHHQAFSHNLAWEVSFEDDQKATLFALRWA